MKHLLTLLFLMAFSVSLCAQTKITGRTIDRDTKEAMPQTTVQLLKPDSTYVTGAVTDDNGRFALMSTAGGKYIVKFTSIGYKTLCKNIEAVEGRAADLGDVVLGADALTLKGATVTGQAMKVTLKEDTFIYNASAYRTPEGSTIEELVKRLPGAKIDDDGKITINGQEVKKIRVDGKEFMTGDTKTALKNLPTSIVEKVKAYNEKSDMSRVTGIDDGNDETVLDFGLKPGQNRGMFSNVDLSYGTRDRYAERLMGAYFNSKFRTMIFGNANNVNDMGFPGGGGRGNFGRGRNGLNTSKMIGLNMNYDVDKLKIDGSVRWNHNNSDAQTVRSAENFVSTVGSFSNSRTNNLSRNDSWNAQMRLEWKPDTMTNIMFRPTVSYSTNDGRSTSKSASYNDDPFKYSDDPLDDSAIDVMAGDSLMVNKSTNSSISYGRSTQIGGSLQLNRRLGNKGRNVNLRLEGSYNDSDNKNLSVNDVHLYQRQTAAGLDSTYQTNRYNLTPSKNYRYAAQFSYSEPLWKATFLQLSYKFTYSYSKSDRSTYDFSNLGEGFFSGISPVYRGWNNYLSMLSRPWKEYYDDDLSRYSEYKNYTHDIELMFRMIRDKYNFSVGVMAQPQKSNFIRDYLGVHTDTVRTVINVAPTLNFRYRFSKIHNLRIRYRGSTSQPSMSQLLDITDDSDPLNVTKGNPGLKPSFTNNLRIEYNNFLQNHQRFIAANMRYSNTRNSISNMVTYDETTGGRTTQPMNINGDWRIDGDFIFSTSLDTLGHWNININPSVGYVNNVGFLSIDRKSDAVKNVTKNLTLGNRLEGSYRNDWLEAVIDGSFSYDHARNKLQSRSNLDTWQFAYGGSLNVTLPWGMSVSTDLHENSRRGYNDKSMNTNELVWNAQIAQSFLRNRRLTVMLQFYDILKEQSNFSRTINAMQRSDTQFNSINSYAMLHVTYRLNIFGGKEARREMRDRRRGFDGPPSGGPGFDGGRPPRGGFGGRPPRGGFGGRPF